jgi:hypothetical protein
MKKLCVLFLALLAQGSQTFAKSVDVATARVAGYNFMSTKSVEGLSSPEDLQLVYTAVSNAAGNCYYVFNAGGYGFVMVSADDQVIPVLGYSTEGLFASNDIPSHTMWWLQQYTEQITYVVAHQLTADAVVAEEWKILLSNTPTTGQNKTTTAGPLLTTKWSQNPYYNSLCPKSGSQATVTGCVATTMAQIMNYWSYPTKGTGSSSYYHASFGTLSANYGTTTYNWNNMPTQLTSTSPAADMQAVGTLMYHAGIAVSMNYGVNGSSAVSLGSGGPSAEHALKTYFGYTAAKGISRNSYSATQWKTTIINELDNGRVVYYAGTDPSQGAGHAWVADGYDSRQYFHMNWGWGGMYDGYFSADNLVPGTGGTGGGSGNYNSNQRAIIGIQAPGAITPDKHESNNASADATSIAAPSFSNNVGTVSLDANFHNSSDQDYYEVKMPASSRKYSVAARVHDFKNSSNGKTYTVDARFAGHTSKLSLNNYNDITLPTPLIVSGGSSAFFKVVPVTSGAKGTYLLEVIVTDIATGVAEVTSIGDVRVYPNPASDVLHVETTGMKADRILLTDFSGRIVLNVDAAGKSAVSIDIKNVAKGNYFVTIHSGATRISKQVSIVR